MVDHLHNMGIQRWQRCNRKETSSSQIFPSEQKNTLDAINDENVNVDNSVAISAYAAISLRKNEQGQQSRWLWVLPQSGLTADELQLIDKMIAATGAFWEDCSIADSYLQESKLDDMLNRDLKVVIFLASSLNWPTFERHELFMQKKFVYANSANHLLTHPQEKRLVWQKLQRLMIE